jgi:hypothetical protein
MLTLLMVGILTLVSCAAAAGLIASTQIGAGAAKSMAGLEVHPDAGT